MKRQRRVVGAFIKIKLSNGKYSFGRILEKANYAFYNFVADDDTVSLEWVKKQKLLFILAVYNDAVTSGRWIIIGKLPLEPELQVLPLKFIQDKINPNSFEFYDPNTGKTSSANIDACSGLERAAVWEPGHVEDRIVDYFNNEPNIWVIRMAV